MIMLKFGREVIESIEWDINIHNFFKVSLERVKI